MPEAPEPDRMSNKNTETNLVMVNIYDRNRFISKSTLAKLADVSPRTFHRYLQEREPLY